MPFEVATLIEMGALGSGLDLRSSPSWSLIFFLLFFVATVANAREDFFEFSNAPIVKTKVYHQNFIDVVVDNPGKLLRLELTFECGNQTIILFDFNEDNFRTHTHFPATMLVYLGHVHLRLPFVIDPSFRKPEYDVRYGGCLCLDRASVLWRHWSQVTVTPFKFVLGYFDITTARNSFYPYVLLFDEPHQVKVFEDEYELMYRPQERFSSIPINFYHNITQIDFKIVDHLKMRLDVDDISVPMISGFDKILLRKTHSHVITLGRQFMHNFAHFYDPIYDVLLVMPSFHQFNFGNAEPTYGYIMLILYLIVLTCWLSSTHNDKTVPKVKERLEFYIYLLSGLTLLLDLYAFASYRYINFYLETRHSTQYFIFFFTFFSLIIIGLYFNITNSSQWIHFRKICCETVLYWGLWLIVLHGHISNIVLVIAVVIASVATIMRFTQFIVVSSLGDKLSTFLTNAFFAFLHLSFLFFFNLLPIVTYYFYGFCFHWHTATFMFVLFIFLPSVYFSNLLGWSVIRNTILEFRKKKMFNHQQGPAVSKNQQ